MSSAKKLSSPSSSLMAKQGRKTRKANRRDFEEARLFGDYP